MAFTNVQVDLAALPEADRLTLEPMAPAYYSEVKTQQLIIWSPLVLVSFVPVALVQHVSLFMIPVIMLTLAGFIARLVIKKARVKAIALREFDIAYQSGLYWRKTVIIAFNRIQHVEVSSGPLQRKFGLASVKLFTAGGTSVDLKIDGLGKDRAEQVRAYIANKIKEQAG
jgi:membrane protein YdbS with pleckstrin-like domain